MTNLNNEYIEAFHKFSYIYRSKVEYTGEMLRKVNPMQLPMNPHHPITYTDVREIAIKMPEDEYEKFMRGWANYIDLMVVAKDNPMIHEQFEKLHMLVQLLK